MTKQLDLLKDYRSRITQERASADVCESRHKGDVNSKAANAKVNKAGDRAAVLQAVRAMNFIGGATLGEAAKFLGREKNAISGRLTELSTGNYKDGEVLIEKRGRRNGGAIYFLKGRE